MSNEEDKVGNYDMFELDKNQLKQLIINASSTDSLFLFIHKEDQDDSDYKSIEGNSIEIHLDEKNTLIAPFDIPFIFQYKDKVIIILNKDDIKINE